MAITNVTNSFHRTTTTGVTALSFTVPSPATSSVLILDISCPSGTFVSNITQTNVVWSLLFAVNGANMRLEVWIGSVFPSPSISLTINVSTSVNFITGSYSEWSGLGFSPNGNIVTNNGTSNTVATGNKTTTYANVLLLATVKSLTDSFSTGPTNSFTAYASSGAPVGSVPMSESAFRVVTSTGTFSTGWTLTGGGGWDSWLLAIGDTGLIPITTSVAEVSGGPALAAVASENFIATTVTQTDGGPALAASSTLGFIGSVAETDGGPALAASVTVGASAAGARGRGLSWQFMPAYGFLFLTEILSGELPQ